MFTERNKTSVKSSPPMRVPKRQRSSSFCIICIEEVATETACVFECGHTFHPECIQVWLSDHQTCPSCRAIIGSCNHGNVTSHDPDVVHAVINALKENVRRLEAETMYLRDRVLSLQMDDAPFNVGQVEYISLLINHVLVDLLQDDDDT